MCALRPAEPFLPLGMLTSRQSVAATWWRALPDVAIVLLRSNHALSSFSWLLGLVRDP